MKPKPLGEPKEVYGGRIVGVTRQEMQEPTRVIEYEWAYRSPGTRALIIHEGKILITREYRPSQEAYDYRLPGGKVFDSLEEYKDALQKGKDYVRGMARDAMEKECIEEVGIQPRNMEYLHTSKCGATMRWDLFYFLIDDFEEHPNGQQLGEGEVIEPVWKTYEEVKEMCLSGEIKEDRTVAVLLRFLLRS